MEGHGCPCGGMRFPDSERNTRVLRRTCLTRVAGVYRRPRAAAIRDVVRGRVRARGGKSATGDRTHSRPVPLLPLLLLLQAATAAAGCACALVAWRPTYVVCGRTQGRHTTAWCIGDPGGDDRRCAPSGWRVGHRRGPAR